MRCDYHVTLLCGCDVFLDGRLVMPAKPCPWLQQQKLKILQAERRGAADEVNALRDGIREHYAERGFKLHVPAKPR